MTLVTAASDLRVQPAPPRGRAPALLAWFCWAALAAGITAIILTNILHGHDYASVASVYRAAARNWLHGRDLYVLRTATGKVWIHDFLYFPQAAILLIPFAILPDTASEIVWRCFSIGVLAWAMWRLAGMVRPTVSGRFTRGGYFLLLTLLTAPVAAGSANCGQMNLMMAATMVLGAVEVARHRWWWATLWLALGVALKPQVLVLLLLLAALYRPMRWRAALGLAAVLLLPFLTQRPQFAYHQYLLCLAKLRIASNPVEHAATNYNDLFGLLSTFGLTVSSPVQTLLRLLAAGGTLGLCYLVRRRWDRVHAAAAILALAASYIMLFNPRTEGGTYVVAAAALSAFAAWAFLVDRAVVAAWVLTALSAGWVAAYNVSHGLWLASRWARTQVLGDPPPVKPFESRYWLSPLLAIIFLAYLVYLVLSNHYSQARTAPASPADPDAPRPDAPAANARVIRDLGSFTV